MTTTDRHDALPRHAELLLHRLEAVTGHSDEGDVMHMQHLDYAKRAHQLAHHLRAAMMLSDARHYPSALVVLRAALEHHLMDRLIFLARRRILVYPKAKRSAAATWNARLAAAKATDEPDITRWFWDGDGLNVVYRGIHSARSKKGRGQTISSFYFMAADYDPFAGPKKHAGRLAAPFWERRHVKQWAEESAQLWRLVFRHDKVMKALRVNRLLLGRHQQVDVHYAFLSGFAHPSKRGYDAIYGTNTPDRLGEFSHVASELVLLYVIVLAAAELDTWTAMAKRPPRLLTHGWEHIEREVRDAQFGSSYFWFLSGEPQQYDRIESVHTPRGNTTPKVGRPPVDPATLATTRVRYYRDPLERLTKLHESWREMATGLTYRSPFAQ
jgi:hypothetical protein